MNNPFLSEQTSDYAVLCDGFGVCRDGIPVLILKQESPCPFIQIPDFARLESMCESHTLKTRGQAFTIRDILVEHGFCTYRCSDMLENVLSDSLVHGHLRCVFL